MKTIRLDPELTARLEHAAAVRGESLSEFIRSAAAEKADEVLNAETDSFDDVLGVVHGGGGRARHTGAVFADIIAERSSQR